MASPSRDVAYPTEGLVPVSRVGFGVIAMAAYQPDITLFGMQLRSIQAQSVENFLCVISADTEPDRVGDLVRRVTGNDARFVVTGDGYRLGHYLNFERALAQVPQDAEWVALCDQDDRWYPNKLERLIPLLGRYSLVSGQSRVVLHPGAEVVTASTRRVTASFNDLLIQNQVTGAHSVFRRSLLDLALPFPRVNAVTELHDHWLGVCAAVDDGWTVIDEVLQDYVQHSGNVIGEVGAQSMDPLAAAIRIKALADQYEGGHSLRAVSRVCNRLSFGWRRAMLCAIAARTDHIPDVAAEAWAAFGPDHLNGATIGFLYHRLRSKDVATGTVATFLPGLPAELLRRTRLEAQPGSSAG